MAKPRELEKPMSFKEVQDHLGMGKTWLCEQLASGRLIGHKLGIKWKIYPSDLQRFLDQQYSNRTKIKLAK